MNPFVAFLLLSSLFAVVLSQDAGAKKIWCNPSGNLGPTLGKRDALANPCKGKTNFVVTKRKRAPAKIGESPGTHGWDE